MNSSADEDSLQLLPSLLTLVAGNGCRYSSAPSVGSQGGSSRLAANPNPTSVVKYGEGKAEWLRLTSVELIG